MAALLTTTVACGITRPEAGSITVTSRNAIGARPPVTCPATRAVTAHSQTVSATRVARNALECVVNRHARIVVSVAQLCH